MMTEIHAKPTKQTKEGFESESNPSCSNSQQSNHENPSNSSDCSGSPMKKHAGDKTKNAGSSLTSKSLNIKDKKRTLKRL